MISENLGTVMVVYQFILLRSQLVLKTGTCLSLGWKLSKMWVKNACRGSKNKSLLIYFVNN